MSRSRELLTSAWLTVRVQIALGVFFVTAALPKVVDPPSFAHMIYNYRIVPGALINLMALVMPWLELLSGLALILGIWRRSATALVTVMLLVFIVAISINVMRNNPIDCGCFDVHAAGKSAVQRMADMRYDIGRDLAMLVLAVQSWIGSRRLQEEGNAPLPA